MIIYCTHSCDISMEIFTYKYTSARRYFHPALKNAILSHLSNPVPLNTSYRRLEIFIGGQRVTASIMNKI